MFSVGRSAAVAALLLAAAVSGCATKPTSTPEGAFGELQGAFAKGDYGAVYDLKSTASQKAFADDIQKKAEEMKDIPPFARQALGFDLAELAKLPPRDAFKRMQEGVKGSAKLGTAMTGKEAEQSVQFAGATVKKSDVKGDAAVLTVIDNGAEKTLDLVREQGVWKFTTPLAPRVGK